MKKFLLTILCALTTFCAMAQNGKVYSEPLVVTINGASTEPQQTAVTVYENGDGTIDFELKNFVLVAGEEKLGVGNIFLKKLATDEGEDGLQHFSYDGPLAITAGDAEGVELWIGPQLNEIPLKLVGKMNDNKLFVTIDITIPDQVIYVQLGTDDFPPQREGKIYTEPLVVTINGESYGPQEANVTVQDNGDGTINFVLKNFILSIDGDDMAVGNICVENISVEEGEDGLQHFTYNGPVVLQEGDLEGVEMWWGPLLNVECGGGVPLDLQGKMNDDKLFVTIDIDLRTIMEQFVYVQLGTDDFSTSGKVADLNGDGKIDIADAVAILNIMAVSEYIADADLNHDQKVDIADFVGVLNIMAAQ